MKLRMLTGLTAIAFAVSLAGCNTSAPGNQSTTAPTAPVTTTAAPAETTAAIEAAAADSAASTVTPVANSSVSITEAEAKATALTHAGLTESDVTYIYANLDWDDGRQEYEVEFFSNNTEYDYNIDAASGSIISYSRDYRNPDRQNGGQTPSGEVSITEEAARDLALANVPGADATNVRIHLDYDDGRPVYEGTIVHQEMKYDFEISAVDGTILEWDAESVYND